MSKWLRKSDDVVVIAGNDRGKVGKVLGFRNKKVLVQGVNLRKKHMKKSQAHPKGQIIDIECPIDMSNVMHAVDGKGIKLKVRSNSKGEKELYYLDSENKAQLYREVRRGK